MSHTRVNQIIHIMWSTNDQQYIFSPDLKRELNAYIMAITKAKNGSIFAIGGAPDHVHLLTLLPPEISLSSYMNHIKSCSSKWLMDSRRVDRQFSWQNGYLALSTQEEKMDNVCSYIRSDEERHHQRSKNYLEELREMLEQQNIEFQEKYYSKNSFSRIYVHAVWSTYNRIPCLQASLRQELYSQMSAVITKSKGVVHEIGGIEDHVHLLFEISREKALSDLVRDIKTSSTHWLKINDPKRYCNFEWQVGYGALTVSLSNIEIVKRYIQQQEDHHNQQTFRDEWNSFSLKKISLSV